MSSPLLARGNNAINVNGNTVNGKTANIAITSHGSSFYFSISALMTLSGMLFLTHSLLKPRRDRIFHYLTSAVVFVAAIAYFSMGANLGFVPIEVEFVRDAPRVRGSNRAIYYVRYVDWVVTTPLLLLDLLLTAGVAWPSVLWVVVVDEVMIITGLVGALVTSSYKWAYFVFGCVALTYIIYQLVWEARLHSRTLGPDVERAFLMCGSLTAFLWVLYPIAWGVSEGGNIIAPDSEAVFYGILDFLAKPVFGALLLWGHRNIEPSRLGLGIGSYDGDEVVREKRGPLASQTHPPTTTTTNTTTDPTPNTATTGLHVPAPTSTPGTTAPPATAAPLQNGHAGAHGQGTGLV